MALLLLQEAGSWTCRTRAGKLDQPGWDILLLLLLFFCCGVKEEEVVWIRAAGMGEVLPC